MGDQAYNLETNDEELFDINPSVYVWSRRIKS